MTNSYIDCAIDADTIPKIGYIQPRNEIDFEIPFLAMGDKKDGKRGTRPPSAPAMKVRRILAANLTALIDRDYPRRKFKTESARQTAVARDAGTSWSSIQRALNPKDGKTLDMVADLAIAFRLKACELLDPELADSLSREDPDGDDKSVSHG